MHKYIITRYQKKSLKYPTLLLSFQLVIASLNTIHIHTQSQIYHHQIKIKNRLIVKVLSLKTGTITKNNKHQQQITTPQVQVHHKGDRISSKSSLLFRSFYHTH